MAFSNVGLPYHRLHQRRCTDGAITEGERIPSVRDMAELMQVAPNTVVHAYDKLALRGLVLSHARPWLLYQRRGGRNHPC